MTTNPISTLISKDPTLASATSDSVSRKSILSFWDKHSTKVIIGGVIFVAIAAITLSCLLFIPGAPLAIAGAAIAGFIATKLSISFTLGVSLCAVGFTALPPMLAAGVAMLWYHGKQDIVEVDMTPTSTLKPEEIKEKMALDLARDLIIVVDGQEFKVPSQTNHAAKGVVSQQVAEEVYDLLQKKIPDELQFQQLCPLACQKGIREASKHLKDHLYSNSSIPHSAQKGPLKIYIHTCNQEITLSGTADYFFSDSKLSKRTETFTQEYIFNISKQKLKIKFPSNIKITTTSITEIKNYKKQLGIPTPKREGGIPREKVKTLGLYPTTQRLSQTQ